VVTVAIVVTVVIVVTDGGAWQRWLTHRWQWKHSGDTVMTVVTVVGDSGDSGDSTESDETLKKVFVVIWAFQSQKVQNSAQAFVFIWAFSFNGLSNYPKHHGFWQSQVRFWPTCARDEWHGLGDKIQPCRPWVVSKQKSECVKLLTSLLIRRPTIFHVEIQKFLALGGSSSNFWLC
jgi:hypothetical protein